jgi:uncharacterized protein YjiS (DUF1127 family)
MNELLSRNAPSLYMMSRLQIKKIYSLIRRWRQNARTRHQLSELPDYLLDDIGVVRQQAQKEARKYFWK